MTIKIAHLSDSHFSERGRLQDVVDVHRAFLQQAKDAKVDFIVHAGDWFHQRSTPAERIALANFIEEAMHVAPIFGVKGNHDADLDLDLFPRLDVGGDGVVICDRPTAMIGTGKVYWLGDHARSGGHGDNRKLGLLALPWFDKAHLVSQLNATADQEETRRRTITAAQDLLTCLRAEATRLKSEGAVPILVGHVLVAGSEVSTGQTLIGTTVELSPQVILDVGASYAALGHIHKSQEWFEGRVAYSGSPHRVNLGEPEAKGWRIVTLSDEGEFISNEFMELPARRIVLLEADWSTPEAIVRLQRGDQQILPEEATSPDVENALVRFRYRIRPEDLHLVSEDGIAAWYLNGGSAADVQIEAVLVHETRARVPEIATVQSTSEKLDAYLKAKSIEVDAWQRERLHGKLAALEVAS